MARVVFKNGNSLSGKVESYSCDTPPTVTVEVGEGVTAAAPVALIERIEIEGWALTQSSNVASPTASDVIAIGSLLGVAGAAGGATGGTGPRELPLETVLGAVCSSASGANDLTWLVSLTATAAPSVGTQTQVALNGNLKTSVTTSPRATGFAHRVFFLDLLAAYQTNRVNGVRVTQNEVFSQVVNTTFDMTKNPKYDAAGEVTNRRYWYLLASNYHHYNLGVSSSPQVGAGAGQVIPKVSNLTVQADLRYIEQRFFSLQPKFDSLGVRLFEGNTIPIGRKFKASGLPVRFSQSIETILPFESWDAKQMRGTLDLTFPFHSQIGLTLQYTIDYVENAPPNRKRTYQKPTIGFTLNLGS